jgi:rare lipoprotein A
MREVGVFSFFKLPVIILILIIILLSESTAQVGFVQKGKASFYHNKFHGRRTSSGERLDQNELTGAHRKFLFNTVVRVTNLNNDRSVIVRINDRGPYKYKNRIIDLTYAAAKKIGLIKKGLAPVKIEIIGEDGEINHTGKHAFIPGLIENEKSYNFRGEERTPKGYGVQVAAFHELTNARYYAHVLFREGFGEVVIKVGNLDNLPVYKVTVGDFHSKIKCMKFIPKLKKKDFNGFLVKY